MRKNRIRLTESQLHRVIKESVKRILSEANWKTYANAAKKMRSERGNSGYWREKGDNYYDAVNKAADANRRADRLGQAAKDAFNRDYGYKNGDWRDDDYAEVRMGGDFGATEEFGPHASARKREQFGGVKDFPHGVYTFERTPEDFFKGNPHADDAVPAYNKAKEEISNYKKGNYDYEKGKGWQLKK